MSLQLRSQGITTLTRRVGPVLAAAVGPVWMVYSAGAAFRWWVAPDWLPVLIAVVVGAVALFMVVAATGMLLGLVAGAVNTFMGS